MRTFKNLVLVFSIFAAPTIGYSQGQLSEWNQALLESIGNARMNPGAGSRATAIMHLSVYDAVNGIHRAENPNAGFQHYHVDPAGALPSASKEAAAATSAHRSLSALFPDRIAAFDRILATQLGSIPDGDSKSDGIAWGESVADQILSLRNDDGSDGSEPYESSELIGRYAGNWGSQHFRSMKPFAIDGPSQFPSAGPPALTSGEYATAINEVATLGAIDSAVRTEDQSQAALFWQSPTGTSRPSGQWLQIGQVYAENEALSLHDSSRLYGLLGIAMADSAIVTWDNKSNFDFWRPRTAIHNADQDGNVLTDVDATWEPLNGAEKPGSSPEHISGQSTFNGAGSTILSAFNEGDEYPIAFSLDTLGSDTTRSFSSFSDAANEAGRSRIYLGVHYEFTNQASLAIGRNIGDYVISTQLLPVPEPKSNLLFSCGILCLVTRQRKSKGTR